MISPENQNLKRQLISIHPGPQTKLHIASFTHAKKSTQCNSSKQTSFKDECLSSYVNIYCKFANSKTFGQLDFRLEIVPNGLTINDRKTHIAIYAT